MAERFTKPGVANVSPADLKKLGPLLKHYRTKAHPFRACYRDQIKHGLSPGHAARRCAVLKDLIHGGTGWRKGGKKRNLSVEELREIVDLADASGLDCDQLKEARRVLELAEQREAVDMATTSRARWLKWEMLNPDRRPEGRRELGRLKPGETVNLPGDVKIQGGKNVNSTVHGSYAKRPYRVIHPDGSAQPAIDADTAMLIAMDASARSQHPESLGGTTAYPDHRRAKMTSKQREVVAAKGLVGWDSSDRPVLGKVGAYQRVRDDGTIEGVPYVESITREEKPKRKADGATHSMSYMGESVRVRPVKKTPGHTDVVLLSGKNSGKVRRLTKRQADTMLIPEPKNLSVEMATPTAPAKAGLISYRITRGPRKGQVVQGRRGKDGKFYEIRTNTAKGNPRAGRKFLVTKDKQGRTVHVYNIGGKRVPIVVKPKKKAKA